MGQVLYLVVLYFSPAEDCLSRQARNSASSAVQPPPSLRRVARLSTYVSRPTAANFYVCVLTGVSFATRFSTRLRQVLFGGWKVGALIVFAYVILNQKGSQTR